MWTIIWYDFNLLNVCVCMRACVRACVRVCGYVCMMSSAAHTTTTIDIDSFGNTKKSNNMHPTVCDSVIVYWLIEAKSDNDCRV